MSRKVKEKEAPDLSAQQVKALGLLLAGQTQRDVAAELGINEATISRWLNYDTQFIAAHNAGLQSLYDAGLAELLDLRRRAFGVLGDLLGSGDEATRLKAAGIVLRQEIAKPSGPTDPNDIFLGNSLADLLRQSGP